MQEYKPPLATTLFNLCSYLLLLLCVLTLLWSLYLSFTQAIPTRLDPTATLWANTLHAVVIAIGKTSLAILVALTVIYFRLTAHKLVFGAMLLILMWPLALPTGYMAGFILPITTLSTALFLFKQFYLTASHDLVSAARIDGAGSLRFLSDILLPLSKANIAALFAIQFTYSCNQYLWPI